MSQNKKQFDRMLEFATEDEKSVLLCQIKKDDPIVKRGNAIIKKRIASRMRVAKIYSAMLKQ